MNLCKDCKYIKDGHPFTRYACWHPNITSVCPVTGNTFGSRDAYIVRIGECNGKWFEEKPIRWYQFWRKP